MEKEVKKLSTGTTTVGVKAKECVVLSADTQSTLANIVSSDILQKIYKINDKMAVTIAGNAGDALTIVRFLKTHAKLFEIERENKMTPKAAITFLSNILNSNRYFPFITGFILGGFNGKPELYNIDPVGGFEESDNFASTGSGFELALGYLEEQFQEGMSEEKGIEIAVKAIKTAKKREIYTGGRTVNVFVVDRLGVREIPRKQIEKYLQ